MKKIKSNPYKTLLTICTGLAVVFFFSKLSWFLYSTIIIGIFGLSHNKISFVIEKIWFKIAEILGYIIPNILLSLIFYFFLFPIALISKIFNKKDLLKLKTKENSTYVDSNKNFNSSSFKNPW